MIVYLLYHVCKDCDGCGYYFGLLGLEAWGDVALRRSN